MVYDIGDYDPNMGQADRAKRRKDFPRGTGTGQPDIEEGGAIGNADAYSEAIRGVTPGTMAGAAGDLVRPIFGTAPAQRTYANSASFPDPQDNPGAGPVSNLGYVPAQGQEPGRFTLTPEQPRPVAGPVAATIAAAPAAAGEDPGGRTPYPGLQNPQGSGDSQAVRAGINPNTIRTGIAAPVEATVGTASGTRPDGSVMNRSYTQNDLNQMAGRGVSGGGGIGADGMTDAQRMNAPFHQAYTQMQAERKGQDASQAQFINDNAQRNQRLAAAPGYRDMEMAKSEARVAQFQATNGADMVLAGGNDAYQGQRLGILQAAGRAQDTLARMEGQVQAANVSPRRDLVAEQIAQQHGADASATSQLGAAQTALMNPLAVQAQKQATSSAGTLQKIGEAGLADRQNRLDVLRELSSPATKPERRQQLESYLRAEKGQREQPNYTFHTAGGGEDDAGRKLPARIYRTDPFGGGAEEVGGQGKPAASYSKGERRTMNGETREFDGKEWKKI